MEQSTFSHSSNYVDNNNNNNNRSQLSQQFPTTPSSATTATTATSPSSTVRENSPPISILGILKEGKMSSQLSLGNCKSDTQEKEWLLKSIVVVINQLLDIGDNFSNNHPQFLPENMKLPAISIDQYITRILKYSPCSKECFITILMYIDRLITQRNFIVNSYNIHRILITNILVAAKYLDDIFYNNQFYSQVGGISVGEINQMEIELLKLLGFDISAKLELYNEYCVHIEQYNKKIQTQLKLPNIHELKLVVDLKSLSGQNPSSQSISNSLSSSPSSSSDEDKSTNKSNNNVNSLNNNNNSFFNNTKPNTNNNTTSSFHQPPISTFRFPQQPNCVA